MDKNVTLLLIDPQNDFCDIPQTERNGQTPALPVTGADDDMKRLGKFIERNGASINRIIVTLDSHQPVDIAHPAWWCDQQGNAPTPFTLISAEEIEQGIWRSRDPDRQTDSLAYAKALQASGRYVLVIWPEHCLIGTWGTAIHAAVKQAIDNWARKNMKQIDYVYKGMNPATEHYSAIQAEVPDANDPATQVNKTLLKAISEAGQVLIAGEALSHCVANTVRDIASHIDTEEVRKLALLTDCTSSVTGFEKMGSDFVAEMKHKGMLMATTSNVSI